MTTPKQAVGLSQGVAEHAEKLPTKSEEVLIRSERRKTVKVKRDKEILNVALKFDKHGDYNGTWYDSTSKKCKQSCKNSKAIGKVGKLQQSSEV